MKLAEQLMADIEKFWTDVKTNHPFYTGILGENIEARIISSFIANTDFIVNLTPVHLSLAKNVSLEYGEKDLADFFLSKIKEESGQNHWAHGELIGFRNDGRQTAEVPPLETILSIARYNENLIKKNPYLYMVHIFFAEYFTDIASSQYFSRRKNISDKNLVHQHTGLDKKNINEFKAMFSNLPSEKIGSPEKYRTTLQDVFGLYKNFWTEILDNQERAVA